MPTRKLPLWIKQALSPASSGSKIFKNTYAKGLHTVCREARCPNRGECESRGTATFLILAIDVRVTADSVRCNTALLPPEPRRTRTRRSVNRGLGLHHAVITSVTRDDLPDGGASVFAQTIQAIKKLSRERQSRCSYRISSVIRLPWRLLSTLGRSDQSQHGDGESSIRNSGAPLLIPGPLSCSAAWQIAGYRANPA